MKLEKQAVKQIKDRTNKDFTYYKKLLLGQTEEKRERQDVLTNGFFTSYFKQKEQIEKWSDAKILRELKKRMKAEAEKDTQEAIKKIQEIKAIEKPTINITCKIDWYRNNTWGYCPKGEYWSDFGYNYIGGITGCGYDKTSSWTAKAFNKDKFLKAYISHFVEKKHITRKNIREKLGYGISIYNGQISFDGGVGISSHITILKNLGFRVDYQSGKTWDALRITKK